ncbi:MAG TPA: mannonate dehydratase [Anaerolineae bacterium]|nr:mannonate dehydratase [Anaerolineae bacterium]
MIKLATVFRPGDTTAWKMAKQCGVNYVVGGIPLAPRPDLEAERQPWSYMSLLRAKTAYNDAGFEFAVIESRPPMEKAKLGLPGRDEEIEVVCELIRNMGALNIPVWCYQWMATVGVVRTSRTIPSRGGALVTGYDHDLMRDAPLTEQGVVTEERMWDNLQYFLERVVPVAEAAGVKLAMHPDDPPLSPIRGIGRIMTSIENYQRLLDLVPSPVNGIALCQGNFTLITDDLPGAIRHFGGQGKIFFGHFRDVRGTPEKFVETFHDDGKTDMLACLRAYRDTGYEGVLRPDHYPVMEGDDPARGGHAGIARLFAIGYFVGLREAVYAE